MFIQKKFNDDEFRIKKSELSQHFKAKNIHESNNPMLESDKPRLVYQASMLTRLGECDIAGGTGAGTEDNNQNSS